MYSYKFDSVAIQKECINREDFFMLFRIEDAEIYYEIVGEGKPVIIIHGCAPDHRLMMKCMESVFQKR